MLRPTLSAIAPTTLAMADDNFLPFSFPTVSRKQITAAFDGGRLTSDGGVMLLAMAEPVVDKSKRCLGGAECLVMAQSWGANSAQILLELDQEQTYRCRSHSSRFDLQETWSLSRGVHLLSRFANYGIGGA